MAGVIPIIPALVLVFQQPGVMADEVIVGNFSVLEPGDAFPERWEELTFPKIERHTRYKLIRDNDRTVVRASSAASASGMIRYFSRDAEEYPWLTWQWKIDHVLEKGNVLSKQGDDYAARLYVAFSYSPEGMSWWQRARYQTANLAAGGKLPGSALNYIWANKAAIGTVVDNPYTDQTRMIVLQSGNTAANQWRAEKRNLVKDYEKAFGRKPPPVMGIAIMTDTDNTGETTTAYYGDIRMSDE